MSIKLKHVFTNAAGEEISLKSLKKIYRDVLIHHHGTREAWFDGGHLVNGDYLVDDGSLSKKLKLKKRLVTSLDIDRPLQRTDGTCDLRPGPQSPICQKCELDTAGAQNPYMPPAGSTTPKVTLILDSISFREDMRGELATDGSAAFLAKIIQEMASETGLTLADVRWAPITRCAKRHRSFKADFKIKGGWCRNFLIQDLRACPPNIIVPVGSAVLGLLSYRSNVQDWGGRKLWYRGLPDDWLMDPTMMVPRPHLVNLDAKVVGHPLHGPPSGDWVPIIPIQSPRVVYGSQNPRIIARWRQQLKETLTCAAAGKLPYPNYRRPWYRITSDPDEIELALQWLIEHPKTIVCFDTETTGLLPWKAGEHIVFMMFRWVDDAGQPRAIGFPWDDDVNSAVKPYIPRLTPTVLKALYASWLVGHNVTFDVMFVLSTVTEADTVRLSNAARFDTWHMAYTLRQARGSLGLDSVTHEWVPELAGYDDEFTILIAQYPSLMDPEVGGNYARCPSEHNDKLETYVMGDVETCYVARERMAAKLEVAKTYRIPLAHTTNRGRFRLYGPPSRNLVYHEIISPASRLLMKFMARGMQVDVTALENLEDILPKQLREKRDEFRYNQPAVLDWCERMENSTPGWELDLEKKEHLQDVLFRQLDLPIERLTDSGKALYGEDPTRWAGLDKELLIKFAQVDKYTLNRLSVDHPQLRSLKEYRKMFKLYSSYVRPIRNSYSDTFDKRRREKPQHLAKDGRVHARFLLTATRSGRLASAEPNLQQLPRDGLIKKVYVPRFGDAGAIYQGDLSQIELRLIAAACGDKAMVEAYCNDIDLHSLTHSRLFKLPYEECVKDHQLRLQQQGKDEKVKAFELQRKISKTLNFLTGYGGGAYGFQATLAGDSIYLPIEECERFLDGFFDSYPSLREYLSYYKRFIMDHGVAVSILGRVRIFEEVFSDNQEFKSKALRAGCNHLIQATASDMMLICMCVIEEMMRVENLESVLISTVHDSLVIDAKRSELPIVHEIVHDVFNNMADVLNMWFKGQVDLSWMIVPFSGDMEVGKNYFDLRKIPASNIDWDALLDR